MITRICYAMAVLCIIALAILPALAHTAPSGWSYDPICCSGLDCAPAPIGSVTATDAGWLVELVPGDHPLVTGLLREVIPFADERIRISGDELFHACVSGYSQTLICLYVPEGVYGS